MKQPEVQIGILIRCALALGSTDGENKSTQVPLLDDGEEILNHRLHFPGKHPVWLVHTVLPFFLDRELKSSLQSYNLQVAEKAKLMPF